MGPIWEVVGGLQRGGLLVRIGKETPVDLAFLVGDTSSDPVADRLQTGAFVRQLDKDGDRLCYELLLGPTIGVDLLCVAGQAVAWQSKLLAARSDLWEVVGGGEKGGLLVRRGRDLTSDALDERLATGSWVKELEPPKDGRLHFARLTGSGPEEGYVSLQVAGKELLKKAASHQAAIPPAPLSSPSAPSSRKLRIFALAGSITCKELLKFQCGQLAALLGKDAVEWTYAEGTVFHPWELSEQLSDFERTVAGKRQQLISWYEDIYHCKQDRPILEKQFDPTVVVESVEIPEKVALLRKRLEEEGPFDVLLGFSQGCIMIHYLVGHLRREGLAVPCKLLVFFEGMHIRDQRFVELFETPVKHPSIHIFGETSPYYAYAREGRCTTKRVEEYYENPLVLTHAEGHNFPTQPPRSTEIYTIVKEQILQLRAAAATSPA
ncbi:unnamed protein product [Symbiodinium sp. KB8]|nr:unnamed protein product [Symbiodinium sp. KB8]